VPGIGGGICQVADTIFKGALYSGLPMVHWINHQTLVPYYQPPGMDATVYVAPNSNADVRFQNDTGHWLLIKFTEDLANARLGEELFGPSTLVVAASSVQQMLQIARQLDGQLTATIHGTDEDLRCFRELVDVLREKAGRLIVNGFPTGVEVCPSMQHGGPYPATTYSGFTSVGQASVRRFLRPGTFQDVDAAALPPELRS